MKKGEDWWIWAMAANSMRSGNKKGNNGGCFSAIIGLVLVVIIFSMATQKDFRDAVIQLIVAIVVIAIAILILINVRKKKNKDENTSDEDLNTK